MGGGCHPLMIIRACLNTVAADVRRRRFGRLCSGIRLLTSAATAIPQQRLCSGIRLLTSAATAIPRQSVLSGCPCFRKSVFLSEGRRAARMTSGGLFCLAGTNEWGGFLRHERKSNASLDCAGVSAVVGVDRSDLPYFSHILTGRCV